jgi:hypothetical protein
MFAMIFGNMIAVSAHSPSLLQSAASPAALRGIFSWPSAWDRTLGRGCRGCPSPSEPRPSRLAPLQVSQTFRTHVNHFNDKEVQSIPIY